MEEKNFHCETFGWDRNSQPHNCVTWVGVFVCGALPASGYGCMVDERLPLARIGKVGLCTGGLDVNITGSMAKRQKNIRTTTGIWLGVAVFVLAILVRGLYLYESSDNPTFRAPVVDSLTYDQMARRLAGGEGLTPDFFWQPLFYPLFLAAVYRLTDFSFPAVKVIQMILGGVT